LTLDEVFSQFGLNWGGFCCWVLAGWSGAWPEVRHGSSLSISPSPGERRTMSSMLRCLFRTFMAPTAKKKPTTNQTY